jgi:leucyl-tRNA synthetase
MQASSDKIIREIEMFGEDFSGYQVEAPEENGDAVPTAKGSGAPEKGKKGKVAAKATGHTYQFQIMESIGVPRAEIKKFADPAYWLKYFPPIARVSLTHT